MPTFEISKTPSKGRTVKTTTFIRKLSFIQRNSPLAIAGIPNEFCSFCTRIASKRCKCKSSYCSVTCQRLDWPIHSILCCKEYSFDIEMLVKVNSQNNNDYHLFKSLVYNTNDISSDLTISQSFSILKGKVSKIELKQDLARFTANNFTILDDQLFGRGEATYPQGALMNHSCVPTVFMIYNGKHQDVYSLIDISINQELLHTYIDQMAPREERQQVLLERYNFTCDCIRCGDEIIGQGVTIIDGLMKPGCFIPHPNPNRYSSFLGTIDIEITSTIDYYIFILRNLLQSNNADFKLKHYNCIKHLYSQSRSCIAQFTEISKSQFTYIENGEYRNAVHASLFVLSTYLLFYDRNHPIVGLQYLMAAKMLYNCFIIEDECEGGDIQMLHDAIFLLKNDTLKGILKASWLEIQSLFEMVEKEIYYASTSSKGNNSPNQRC